jgi:hypothetical protein
MQLYNGSTSSIIAVDGTFPTTTVLTPAADSHLALRLLHNPTVMSMQCLVGGGSALHEAAILSDLMPTTVAGGKYTDCPTDAHFRLFAVAHKQYLRDLYAAGITVFVGIGSRNEQGFTDGLCDGAYTATVLVECNGSKLVVVQCSSSGREFVMLVPHEHTSHIVWQALKRANRLWLLRGLVEVYSALAALLHRPPLNAEQLIMLLGADKLEGKRSGWYSSGAYCESVMRGARLFQFRALYGYKKGYTEWQKWYTDCKRRGGECNRYHDVPLKRTLSFS